VTEDRKNGKSKQTSSLTEDMIGPSNMEAMLDDLRQDFDRKLKRLNERLNEMVKEKIES